MGNGGMGMRIVNCGLRIRQKDAGKIQERGRSE